VNASRATSSWAGVQGWLNSALAYGVLVGLWAEAALVSVNAMGRGRPIPIQPLCPKPFYNGGQTSKGLKFIASRDVIPAR